MIFSNIDTKLILCVTKSQFCLKKGLFHLTENSLTHNHCKQLTKTSSVLPISRMDFTPAHTTATGVRPNSTRSALMSSALGGCVGVCVGRGGG